MRPVVSLPVGLVLVFAALQPARAATEVYGYMEEVRIPFELTARGYEASQLLSADQPIHIKLDRVPVKVEKREVFQGAVGEDGAWMDVVHTAQAQPWEMLTPAAEFEIALRPDSAPRPVLAWPKTFGCEAAKSSASKEECARWSALYARCAPPTYGSPCYTYQSAIELRVWYDTKNPPERVRINFPGGC